MSAQPVAEAGVPDMVSELLGRYPIEHQAGQEIVPAPVRFLPRTSYAHIPGLQLTLPADPATASADAGASGGSAASAHAAGTGTASAAAGQAAAQTTAQAAVQASPLERISRPVLERVLKTINSGLDVYLVQQGPMNAADEASLRARPWSSALANVRTAVVPEYCLSRPSLSGLKEGGAMLIKIFYGE